MTCQFYIVATPIGNLRDITLRAIDVLSNVDYIACEDTRVTRILAEKYGFKAKLFDCHKFNEKEKSEKIISLIEHGNTVALVSDAGTPNISDPGSVLLKELAKNNIEVTALPGACAVSTFLSLLPRDNEEYAFIGFIPRNKKQQHEILKKYEYTHCVFYDSPNRLMETLENIKELYGDKVKVVVGRELTKVYEEIKTGFVSEIIEYYKNNTLKGEIVAMVYAKEAVSMEEEELLNKINILKEEGYSPKDISIILSKLYNLSKNSVYKLVINSNN